MLFKSLFYIGRVFQKGVIVDDQRRFIKAYERISDNTGVQEKDEQRNDSNLQAGVRFLFQLLSTKFCPR